MRIAFVIVASAIIAFVIVFIDDRLCKARITKPEAPIVPYCVVKGKAMFLRCDEIDRYEYAMVIDGLAAS